LEFFLLGILFLPAIIHFTVKSAVEEGTYKALIKYEEWKKQNSTQSD